MKTAMYCPYSSCKKEIKRLAPGKLCPHCRNLVVPVEGGYITWADSLASQKVLTKFEEMVSRDRELVFKLPKGTAQAKELKLASMLLAKAREFLDNQAETQIEVVEFTVELVRTFFMTKSRDYLVMSLAQVNKGFVDVVVKVWESFKSRTTVKRNTLTFKDTPTIEGIMRL